jgi:hypothetical protein
MIDNEPPPMPNMCPWHPDQPDDDTCEGCLAEYEIAQENLMDQIRHGEL